MKTLQQRKSEIESKINAMHKEMESNPNFDYSASEDTYNGYIEELADIKYLIALNECDYISASGVPYYN